MLDNRLKICAEMVSGIGIVCDVGTDHAYLPAELIASGKCSRAIASDVREGPLDAAKKTIERYGVTGKVELILSDGLEKVSMKGVSDVVIAGMGGETIIGILSDCEAVFDENISLILQPMTKADELRGWLGSYGFRIIEERAADDGNRVYIIIHAVYDGIGFAVSEFKNIRGFVDRNDPTGMKYLEVQAESLRKKADALAISGHQELALHDRVMAENLLNDDRDFVSSDEIYSFLDSLYPFQAQESWDNSGMLVDSGAPVSTVLLTLDIDKNAVAEAAESEAELIISHHPVIFKPLRNINSFSPVYKMIEQNISAICMHTNLDIASGGTNGVILKKLSEKIGLLNEPEPFEDCGNGNFLGYICTSEYPVDAAEMGRILKDIFGCKYVRMNRHNCGAVSRFAFCSGSGGSSLELAESLGCDAYITGDVKHDVWIDANNRNIVLYDCGHFHTENLVLTELRRVLEEHFPQLEVIIAGSSVDPVVYI